MTDTFAATRARMITAGRTNHMSNVLMRANVGLKRKVFDPTSGADRLQYAYFMETGKWKDGKSFQVELPYSTVPQTVQSKLLRHFLKAELAKVGNVIDQPVPQNVVELRKSA